MKYITSFFFVTVVLLANAVAGVNLEKIIIPASATPIEKFAAKELQTHLKYFTSGVPRIISENDNSEESVIYLGNTAKWRSTSRNIPGYDGWEISYSDNQLVIAGNDEMGVLYGVYEFLEKQCQVYWITQYYTSYPRSKKLNLPKKFTSSGAPVFRYRGIYTVFNDDPDRTLFYIRNRENIFLEDSAGRNFLNRLGITPLFGSPACQDTIYRYIKLWPTTGIEEGLSLSSEGKRLRPTKNTGPGQVCYSSPLARKLFVEQLKKFIISDRQGKTHSQYPKMYCIIQNDVDARCECTDCLTAEKRYGAYSGVLLEFVNYIASKIETDYPDIIIQTDAYMNTEKPPVSGIAANKNVRVRFSPLTWKKSTYNMMAPFPEKGQKSECISWSKIAKIHIWDYWVNFSNDPICNAGILPLDAMVKNHRLYQQCGAEYVFTECEYADTASFHNLRVWLGYKLKIDPNQNIELLKKQYFKAAYQEAAVPMEQLCDLLLAKQRKGDYSGDDRKYLDSDFFVKAEQLLCHAEKLSSKDKNIQNMIAHERVPIDIARLRCIGDEKGVVNIDKTLKRLEKNWRQSIEMNYRGRRVPDHLKRMKSSLSLLSPQKEASPRFAVPTELKGKKVFEITATEINYLKAVASYGTKLVDDPDTPVGKCVMVSKTKRLDSQKFHEKNSRILRFGIYSESEKKQLITIGITKAKFPKNGGYFWQKIGKVQLSPATLFWAAEWLIQHRMDNLYRHGENNKFTIYVSVKVQGKSYIANSVKPDAVCIDRILLVPEKQ